MKSLITQICGTLAVAGVIGIATSVAVTAQDMGNPKGSIAKTVKVDGDYAADAPDIRVVKSGQKVTLRKDRALEYLKSLKSANGATTSAPHPDDPIMAFSVVSVAGTPLQAMRSLGWEPFLRNDAQKIVAVTRGFVDANDDVWTFDEHNFSKLGGPAAYFSRSRFTNVDGQDVGLNLVVDADGGQIWAASWITKTTMYTLTAYVQRPDVPAFREELISNYVRPLLASGATR